MKWWIVGKKGLLAQAFCRYCDEQGIDYIATSREDLNICDEQAVQHYGDSFTHLINCAAYTAVDRAESEIESAMALNQIAPAHLARKAKASRARFIHFSTDYVFDGFSQKPYSEECAPNPQTVYGGTKWRGEQAVYDIYPDSLIVRTSWLFGDGPHHFVKTMSGLIQKKGAVKVINDQWGRPTYAPDLVAAVNALREESGLYHISGAGMTTWYQFAVRIAEELKERAQATLIPIESRDYPTAAMRPRFSALDTQKVENFLQRPLPSWEKGLKEYIHAE